MKITSEEQNRVKRMKRTKDSLTDLWDNIKCTDILIIGVPEEEEKKLYEKSLEEIIAENFPNMKRKSQSSVRGTKRIEPRRNMPRHIIIKLAKPKHKRRILKAAREKQQVTYKGNHIHLTADLSAETLQARREGKDIFKVLKGKYL